MVRPDAVSFGEVISLRGLIVQAQMVGLVILMRHCFLVAILLGPTSLCVMAVFDLLKIQSKQEHETTLQMEPI